MKFTYLLLIVTCIQGHLEYSLKKTSAIRRYQNEIRYCTRLILSKVIKKYTIIRYYTSEVKGVFPYSAEMKKLSRRQIHPSFFSSISNPPLKKNMYSDADLCVVDVVNEQELRQSMSMLYNEVHYDNCIINLMFESNEGQHLEKLAKEIWFKGYPMNIRFSLFSKQTNKTWIIGPAPYSPETCRKGRLIKFGYCFNGEEKLDRQAFTPTMDLGNCMLKVLVHPPFLPYVETKSFNKTLNPGGVIGKLLLEASKLMNFTPVYKWKVGRSDVLSFTEKHNLNLLVDMLPHRQLTDHKYRFTIGPVTRSFVMPPFKHIFRLTDLMNPFDVETWLCVFLIFFLLIIACFVDSKADSVKLLLQTFGIFLGVGIGDFEDRRWFRYFLWACLLPAFILLQAYQSVITRNLSSPLPIQGFETVNELSKSNVKMYCDEDSKILACSLGEEEYKTCRACHNISDVKLYNKVWMNLLQSKMLNNSAYIFNNDIRSAYADVFNDLAVIPEETHLNQIVTVRPGNDYIFKLERIFKMFQESGVIAHYFHKYGKSKITFQTQTSYSLEFQLLYTIVFCGWILSMIVFGLEFIVHYFSKR